MTVTPVSQSRTFLANPLLLAFQTGGCVAVDGLQPGTQYRFAVQAFAARWNGGGTAAVTARVS